MNHITAPTSAPGEIRQEYEKELNKVKEEYRKRQIEEELASKQLILKLQVNSLCSLNSIVFLSSVQSKAQH